MEITLTHIGFAPVIIGFVMMVFGQMSSYYSEFKYGFASDNSGKVMCLGFALMLYPLTLLLGFLIGIPWVLAKITK